MPKTNKDGMDNEHRGWSTIQIAAMIVLGGLLIIMVYLVAGDIIRSRANGSLTPRHHARDLLSLIAPNPQNRPALNINTIQIWMTFDYLNKAFKLPPDYLKLKLGITDTRYPTLSIRHLTDDTHLDPSVVIQSIKTAILERPSATGTAP